MGTMTSIAAHQGLLVTVMQQMRETRGTGIAVSLTAANSGEGVTQSVVSLVETLQRDPATRTLQLDARTLRALAVEPADLPQLCVATHTDGIFVLDLSAMGGNQGAAGLWDGNLQYRKECMEYLRANFDYVLIDCPSLQSASDALTLAPVVDGTILIVEAEKTRKDQILRAEKSIDFARGKIIGHILNKRSYVVPDWVYRRL